MEGFGCHSCKFQQFLESSRFEPDLLFPFCTKERKKKEKGSGVSQAEMGRGLVWGRSPAGNGL